MVGPMRNAATDNSSVMGIDAADDRADTLMRLVYDGPKSPWTAFPRYETYCSTTACRARIASRRP